MNNPKIIITLILIVLVFLMLFPLAILINSSLQTYEQIISWPPKWFDTPLQWSNYYEVLFGEKSILGPFINSLQISIVTMLLCVIIGLLAAYAVTRFHFVGKNAFMIIIICTQMFTSVILVNPMYIIFKDLGLLDTKLALVISSTASSLPMTVWLLYSYFSQVPLDYEEAYWMDGSSRIKGVFHILMPLTFPGIITAGLFAFIASWGDLIYAKSFILSPELRTISLALTNFRDLYKTSWETQMAAAVITIIPPFIMFMIIQKYLIRGMLSQGVKG